MAGGVSKHYESQWVYHPEGTRFEDRVGKILSRGVDLQATFKQAALHTAKKGIEFENKQRQEKGYNPAEAGGDFYKQTEAGSPPPVDARGMVWVTEKGETIGPATTDKFFDLPPPLTPKQKLTTDSQRFVAGLDESQRSMFLWKKVNPGCMEVNTTLPTATYKAHYVYDKNKMEPVNKERFRLKSDFTMYCDASIRGKGGMGR